MRSEQDLNKFYISQIHNTGHYYYFVKCQHPSRKYVNFTYKIGLLKIQALQLHAYGSKNQKLVSCHVFLQGGDTEYVCVLDRQNAGIGWLLDDRALENPITLTLIAPTSSRLYVFRWKSGQLLLVQRKDPFADTKLFPRRYFCCLVGDSHVGHVLLDLNSLVGTREVSTFIICSVVVVCDGDNDNDDCDEDVEISIIAAAISIEGN
ncbi:hypothetical protein BDA99DRAFT_535354 [Phascolomyces articulosus]|uniref:Uncharacterized protein n=1 Tax=Phascolomyces articulosus TaxID=60185 RepID=A0AAD5PGK1_9FUNG|nr:hypothetical protein BDA99DRAFT_535354 [Phascolomyces articulosus]